MVSIVVPRILLVCSSMILPKILAILIGLFAP